MDMFNERFPEEQLAWQATSVTQQEESVEEPEPLEEQPTRQVTSAARPETRVEEQPTWQAQVMTPQATLVEEPEPLEELPTWPVQAMAQRAVITGELSLPIAAKKRVNWPLYGFSLLLVVLIISGVFLGSTVYSRVFLPKKPAVTPSLQRVLHPNTAVVHSLDVENTAHQFMEAMLQKDWSAMWPMLSTDAQSRWQSEDEFIHFEQAKFGALTLQSYTLSQAVTISPWLNPDTTQVYNSAVTLHIALQAVAPPDLLTAPSNRELERGLFRNTLFALLPIQEKDAQLSSSQIIWRVLVAGPADLDAPVMVPAKAPVTHVIIPIFMYHHVSSQPTRNLLDFNLTVTTAEFNKQLDWMQKQGYQTITMTELFDSFYYGKSLPPKPAIFTFDDGYTDVYTYALPALLAHHYRGTFYIPSGLRNGWYMTWDQVRAMARSGMEIAGHTIHHADLAIISSAKAQTELADSKAELEAQLGTPLQFFCYPYGEPFIHGAGYIRQQVVQDLFEDGYLGATLDPTAVNSGLQNSAQPYEMPRIRVSGGESLGNFIGILNSTLKADAGRLHNLQN